jgi:GNAT superfamily N-acetyltransferase
VSAAHLAIAPLRAEDARSVAALHRTAFPSFFLSTLGEPFLVEFYLAFVDDESAVTAVARDADGTPVGAVVGTLEPAGFFSRLLRRRWWGFAMASLRAVGRHPSSAPRLIRAVAYRGGADSPASGALLSSVCVDPALQGSGVGRQLLESWEQLVLRRGESQAFLTTDADGNEAVNGFYQSRGWEVADTFVTREGRSMNRYKKRLGRTP